MQVRDIMTAEVVTVEPALAADIAAKQMRMGRIHHLIVVDGERIVGVLSDRDVQNCSEKRVADLMTSHIVLIDVEAPVRQAAKLMHAYRVHCLPVVDGKKLVGILTTSDILEMVSRTDFAPSSRRAGPAAFEGTVRGPGTART